MYNGVLALINMIGASKEQQLLNIKRELQLIKLTMEEEGFTTSEVIFFRRATHSPLEVSPHSLDADNSKWSNWRKDVQQVVQSVNGREARVSIIDTRFFFHSLAYRQKKTEPTYDMHLVSRNKPYNWESSPILVICNNSDKAI